MYILNNIFYYYLNKYIIQILMDKGHIGIRYGIYKDISNNTLRIHVDDTIHKMKKLIFCEICNTELIARKGDIKVHHFA